MNQPLIRSEGSLIRSDNPDEPQESFRTGLAQTPPPIGEQPAADRTCAARDFSRCYDPAEFNDSLVLGMKGTFAQAELHIIRARLHGGKLNKASRGELRFPLPVGFVFEGDKIVLDPDREVQGAVRMVFDLFEREGTAYSTVRRFQELGLRFPRRAYGGAWDGKLLWGRLTHSRVLGILANPSYAGTYVFGRYQSSKQVGPSGDI